FRGECAAASLKLDHLIDQARDRLGFRGECAAASLKLRAGPNVLDYTSRFRGECAAASLKQADDRLSSDHLSLFPRRMRRGLIEATVALGTPRRSSAVSAANAPRPH